MKQKTLREDAHSREAETCRKRPHETPNVPRRILFYVLQEEFVSFSIRFIILSMKIYHTVNRFFLPETTIDKQSMTRYNIRKEQMFGSRSGI